MKNSLYLFLFIYCNIYSQTPTNVFVFDITENGNKIELQNKTKISDNIGYNNQPYFYNDETILFVSAFNGNTEILLKNLSNQKVLQKSNTEIGSEYSPQRIPNSKNISAVRLDKNGLQRFYKYNYKTKKPTEIIPNLKVAYPTWYNKNTLVSATLVNDSLQLVISNLKKKTNLTIAKNVGRSIHKIPNSNLVSFIDKTNNKYWLLKSLNIETKEIKTITPIGKTEDITWLPNGTLLLSSGNSIYKFTPKKDNQPSLFYSFSDENINNISRMAVNKTGTKIAIVAEVSPRYLAQEQLNGYNNRDINAFLKPFAKNIKVYNFPNELRYEGIENMRKRYEGFFKNTPDLHCELVNRIVFEDKVIDHELVTTNGQQFKAVAIYSIKNGKIVSVTFM